MNETKQVKVLKHYLGWTVMPEFTIIVQCPYCGLVNSYDSRDSDASHCDHFKSFKGVNWVFGE